MSQRRRSKSTSGSTLPTADPREVLLKIRVMLERERGGDCTALRDLGSHMRRDPFKVLISTILSQRTRDENTRRAASALFSVYENASDLAAADLGVIEQLIRPAGFYRVKARKIREVAATISRKYLGKVPADLEELLELPGVGRKTANCVLVYGFAKPAIPVDTHVHRISNRIGLVETKRPEQTEMRLREILHRRYWLDLNELFVLFGQEICRPIGPRCEICDLKGDCKYYRELAKEMKASRRKR